MRSTDMSKLKYLIFDVDNTLLDFDVSFMNSERAVAKAAGIPITDEYFETDNGFMWKAWDEFGLNDTSLPENQEDYHLKYRIYAARHYEYLAEKYKVDIDPFKMVTVFLNALADTHYTMEKETLEVYKALSEKYKIVIATNSVFEVSRRLDIFRPYTYKIFISDELHCIKPSPDFFNAVIKGLDCSPDECLMIGDSVGNDIIGAKRAGMKTCWYKRMKPNSENTEADFAIVSMLELKEKLL